MKILNTTTAYQSISEVKVGQDVKIYRFVNLYGCEIGDQSQVACFVEIQRGVRIGRRCKISSHTFVCEGVQIEDDVFVGHNVSFVNDMFPRATNEDGALQGRDDWEMVETLVRKGASIGTGATILGGVKIGERAMVGAGAVVTKDVPERAVVIGNPAKVIRYV